MNIIPVANILILMVPRPRPNISRKAFVPLWRQLISWVLILMQIVMKYGHNFIVLSKQTRFHLFKDCISMRKPPFRFTRSQLHFPIWLRYRFRRGSEAAPTEPSRDRVGTASETRRNRVGTASEPRRNRVGTTSEARRNRVGTASEPRRNRVGTASGTCWPQKGPL